uniref:Cyclic nucleotide-binding domain-containing protein n=1 Tax=Macrostomum lignano TaxID=282301 RepID=A0A1I8FB24_9PLAT
DSSDEDEDEEDDVPGELPTIATQQSSASKLTAGAASPDAVDEEDEETNRSESPTSAEAREGRLKHRLTSFDKRQEKFSQMKAAVKTYDVNMEMVIGKWKRLREDFIKLRANSVLASGDDGSLMITRRMTEIGNMCSRTTNADYYIATLPESVKQIVKKMAAMPRDVFLEARRRDWTSYDWFMYAGMARVLAQAAWRRLTIDALSNGRSLSEKDLLTNSVSKTLRDCLCFCPEYRTKEMRQKMEEECTKYVFYEKYQDGRILSLVDRVPEKFYYVISGKSGADGASTPKKFTLVTSGVTEVLSLGAKNFLLLLKGTGGLPLNFLKNIGIFQEFPCGKFLESPEAIATRYFPKDRVILDDITDTPYIHVIKSPQHGHAGSDQRSGSSRLSSSRQNWSCLGSKALETPWPTPSAWCQREQQKSLSRDPMKNAEKRRQQQQQRLPKLQTAAMRQQPRRSAMRRLRRHPVMELKLPADEHDSPGAEDSAAQRAAPSEPARPASRRPSGRRAVGEPRAARVLLGPEGFPPERPQREAYVVLDTLRNGDFLGFKNITTLIEGKRIVRDKKKMS